MKIIKFFTILFAPLVIGVFSCILILKVCNINFEAVFSLLLSKIPVVNNFVTVSSNTGLYAISQVDQAKLVTSSYNVDFLVSFYQAGKKTILLYPYEVEAGVNLELAEQSKQDSLTVITLPNAQITKANLSEKKDNYVIRNQVDISSNYDNLIKPLKTALERRAKDLAINSGILAKANQGAEDYLKNLFPQNFIFQKEEAPVKRLKEVSAPHIPVTFTYQDENITDGSLTYQRDENYQRDEMSFDNINLQYGEFSGSDFNNYDEFMLSSESLYLRIIDPLNPNQSSVYSQAVSKWSIINFANGLECFLIPNYNNKEDLLQKIAPDLLYLAMSASLNDQLIDADYVKWVEKYKTCIENINTGQFKVAERCLFDMKNLRGSQPISFKEQVLASYVDIMNGQKFVPTGDDEIDFWFKLMFNCRNYLINDISWQHDVLAKNDNFIERYKTFLLQLFYDTPVEKSVKAIYAKEIIERADQYYHPIAEKLQGNDYCNYVSAILRRYDSSFKEYNSQNFSQTRILYHDYGEDGEDGEFKNANWIVDQLIDKDLYNPSKEQVIIAFVQEGYVFDDNVLLVIRKDNCSVYSNVTGSLPYGKALTVDYKYVDAAAENKSTHFKIGSYEYKNLNNKYINKEVAIAKLLNDIAGSQKPFSNFRKQQLDDFFQALQKRISDMIINKCY